MDSSWQDIATAPKDGNYLVLADEGYLTIGVYVDFEGAPPEGYHSGWFDGMRELHPTHWFPVPPPPVQGGTE